MINSDMNNGGIYRAFILGVSSEVRIYIPALFNNFKDCPINSDGSLNMEVYNKCKEFYPIPIWCLPNIEAKQYDEVHPCWVTFENGNINKPIIMGFLGNGIKYHAGSSGDSTGSSGTNTPDGGTYTGSGTTDNTNGDYIFRKLIEAGASIAGACAVLGNIYVESKFDINASYSNHYGIAQWDSSKSKYDRWHLAVEYCKNNNLNENSIEGQTAYLIYDLQTESTWMKKTNNEGWNKICKINSEDEVKSVTDLIRLYYERCDDQGAEDRRTAAIKYWNIFKDGKIENGRYTSNNSAINNYLIDNAPGGTRNNAKEHGSGSGTQCVELPNDYIQEVFGLTNHGGFGNGNEYYKGVSKAYPNKFDCITYQSEIRLLPGDIISLKGSNTTYGHVAIVKAVNGNEITILEQWAGSGTVREATFTITNSGKRKILGIARPK